MFVSYVVVVIRYNIVSVVLLCFAVIDDGIIANVGYCFVVLVDGGVLGIDISKVGAVVSVDVAVPNVIVYSDIGLTGGLINRFVRNNLKLGQPDMKI